MYQNLLELCKNRHSIRNFINKPVSEEKIKRILEIVQTAPTAGNLQAYQVVVIQNNDIKEKLVGAALGQSFIKEAPIVMVFLALPNESGKRYRQRGINLYAIQDATIACTHAMLGAQTLGLASTWVGAFNEEEVQKAINADQTQIPIAILPIGYAEKEPYPTQRRSIEDIARFI